MRIQHYCFGSLTVGGEVFKNDVIVFPDRVCSNWVREAGHVLSVEDLDEVCAFQPEVLIVGTGAYGSLRVPPRVKNKLEGEHIDVIDVPTEQACHVFNKFAEQGKRAVGAFHLTC
jgi:hypothetical protein